ncbi:osmoprotectant transport system substrate-binding protein [Natronoarchaeum philippinense]|uniref:Osmoprotectant transport system substrate-binding protein n=1 Tax=Natronoarchaeum philippinense TaxID=558529 RepID=A0A285P850_NATPI|nr:glycine betaine ABC transporter substrate-binding protein [Natronoarchaeum philippinense]SNZ17919.1 osmoprotectant transport system substrate-binding protein [Natronoarchaeum philippinense]
MARTRRGVLGRLGAAAGTTLLSSLAGCSGSRPRDSSRTTVRVGSKPFPEQEILGTLAYERLQGLDDVQVVNEIGYGDSLANWRATTEGVKHLYWEYTGTAWVELPPRHDERITDPQRLYERAAEDASASGLDMASPASFSNEYVLVADREWSERTGVATISDLIAHAEAGNTDFGVAVNQAFFHRQDGWRGVTAYYGLDADVRTAIEAGPFVVTSVALPYVLLSEGQMQVASGFATDPQLDRLDAVVLDDDREYFLPYQPVPTAHAPTVEAQPRILGALEPIVASLDEATIRRLTGRVLFEGASPTEVARSHLDAVGELP